MKKKINRKKVLIVSIIIVIIISVISFFVIRNIRGNRVIAPNIEEIEEQNDGMLKYENNISIINIGDRKIKKIDNKNYIVLQIENNTEEDKFDIPIGIEFVNLDGDVIYNTGYVVSVLLKGMVDEIYASVTPQIADMIKKEKIDRIVIKELE